MKESEIKIGGRYIAKVYGKTYEVEVNGVSDYEPDADAPEPIKSVTKVFWVQYDPSGYFANEFVSEAERPPARPGECDICGGAHYNEDCDAVLR
jgi:hypothetical protein